MEPFYMSYWFILELFMVFLEFKNAIKKSLNVSSSKSIYSSFNHRINSLYFVKVVKIHLLNLEVCY